MNYIAEIRAFYDWIPFNSTPADAQALWHALMYLNNKCAVEVNGEWFWRVEFSVSNQTLLSILGFSRTQLDRMRNILIQSGRIRYRKGKGNQAGTYQMVPFDAHYVAQPGTQLDTQTGTQTGTQLWHKRGPLNNYNNTSNSNSNLPFVVGGEGSGADGNESAQFVENYLSDRDLSINQYFGADEEVKATAAKITHAIFKKMSLRHPTAQDVFRVFRSTKESSPAEGDSWKITFPKNRVELLLYAFEQASAVGCPGNWKYIEGCLGRLAERGISTLSQAEDFDYAWDSGGH